MGIKIKGKFKVNFLLLLMWYILGFVAHVTTFYGHKSNKLLMWNANHMHPELSPPSAQCAHSAPSALSALSAPSVLSAPSAHTVHLVHTVHTVHPVYPV